MEWRFNPYAAPLLVGTAVLAGVAVMSWRRRSIPVALWLLLLCLTGIAYTLGYAFELSSSSLEAVRFWLKVEYLGTPTAPTILFLFLQAYFYSHRRSFLHYALPLVIPLLTLIFAWTNDRYELIWRDLRLVSSGGYYFADFTPGSWYWVNIGYTAFILLASALLLFGFYRRASGLYRRQIGIMLLAVLVPFGGMLLYRLDLFAIPLDLNPFSVTVTAILMAWGIFNYRLMDIMPVARELVLASMPDAVIVLDVQQRVVDLNASAQKLLGMSLADSFGRPAAEVVPQWDEISPALSQDQPQNRFDFTLTHPTSPRFFDVRTSAITGPDGAMLGFLIVLRDVTGRTLAERALQKANERLARLRAVDEELTRKLDVRYVTTIALETAVGMSQADVGFIGLSEDGRLRIIDRAGCCPDSLLNTFVEVGKGICARVMQSRQSELVLDVSQDTDYIEVVPGMQAQMTVPLISGEKLIGILALETRDARHFTHDTFELVNLLAARVAVAIDNSYMYEERDRLVKELDAFAYTVAHDLKTPLTVLLGYSEVLKDDFATMPPEQIAEFLSVIAQTSHKMGDIISELLLLASLRKMSDVNVGPLDMAAIVDEARRRLRCEIEAAHGVLVIPDEWPEAIGYAPWVEEVWVNYISNAIKYGGTPPCVELGAAPLPDGAVRFWVRDNGHGLSEEAQSRLFTEFNRQTRIRIEGHGLGLSIVRRIVERLGGEVGVESAVGQGSIFSFTLPGRQSLGSIPDSGQNHFS